MIDVRVGMRQAPKLWVLSKIRCHIFVDQTLEIDTDFSVGSNQNIRANTTLDRHISVGISDNRVAGIVVPSHPDLGSVRA
jgi:hypothetical protein